MGADLLQQLQATFLKFSPRSSWLGFGDKGEGGSSSSVPGAPLPGAPLPLALR